MSLKRDIDEFNEEVKQRGWEVSKTNGGHYRYSHPRGGLTFGATTPSDHRGLLNLARDIRKIEKENGTYQMPVRKVRTVLKLKEHAVNKTPTPPSVSEKYRDSRDPWPNLPAIFTVTASVVNDSRQIRIVLPDEFAGMRVFLSGEPSRRALILTTDAAGIEIRQGMKESFFLLDAAVVSSVRPMSKSHWNTTRAGSEIRVGTLIDFLSSSFVSRPKPEPQDLPTPISTLKPLIANPSVPIVEKAISPITPVPREEAIEKAVIAEKKIETVKEQEIEMPAKKTRQGPSADMIDIFQRQTGWSDHEIAALVGYSIGGLEYWRKSGQMRKSAYDVLKNHLEKMNAEKAGVIQVTSPSTHVPEKVEDRRFMPLPSNVEVAPKVRGKMYMVTVPAEEVEFFEKTCARLGYNLKEIDLP